MFLERKHRANKMKVKYSIVIPVYNVGEFLPKCLDSILKQKKSDYEIIIVDDGSTDSSGEICDQYREMYPDKIEVIHKKNQGLISARVTGRRKSRGEYIIHVDSDDYLSDDALEQIDYVISRNNIDLLIFNFMRVDEDNRVTCKCSKKLFPDGRITRKELFEKFIEGNEANALWIKVARRELFDLEHSYEQYYDISMGEDLLQSLYFCGRASNIYYLGKPLYCYRCNPNSITHSFNKAEFKRLDIIRPLLYRRIKNLGYLDNVTKRKFHIAQLGDVWDVVLNMSESDMSNEEFYRMLDQVLKMEHVKKSYLSRNMKYVRLDRRIGLNLLCRHKWILLRKYAIQVGKLKRYIKPF